MWFVCVTLRTLLRQFNAFSETCSTRCNIFHWVLCPAPERAHCVRFAFSFPMLPRQFRVLGVTAHGRIQAVTLGSRVLRSDVAVNSLLALAHAWVDERAVGVDGRSPSLTTSPAREQ